MFFGDSALIISRESEDDLVLTDSKRDKLPSRIVMGIWPEDIFDAELEKGKRGQIASCTVSVVEPAGADTYVLLPLGGVEVTARLKSETKATAGSGMDLLFNMNKVSYFDARTGQRLN